MHIDVKKDTFNIYGNDYQLQLFRDMMNDKSFGYDIINKIKPIYFSDRSFVTIMKLIKGYYHEHDTLPSPDELKLEVKMKLNGRGIEVEQVLDTVENIKNCVTHNKTLKKSALNFCKTKSLDSAMDQVKKRIDKGIIEDYDSIEDIMREAIIRNDRQESTDLFYDIEAALKEDYRNPIRTGIQGFDELLDGGLGTGEVGLIIAPLGVGKAQPLSSKILTPNGWTTMGEIKIGDEVVSRDGKPTNVIGVYPQGKRPIYQVTFNDGTSTLCDEEHLWSVNSINQRNRKTRKNGKPIVLPPDNSYQVVKTKDMIDRISVWGGKQLNFKVPIVEPVNFIERELEIHPYILGAIIGDGCITEHNHPSITTKDYELFESINEITNNVRLIEQSRNVVNSNGDVIERNLLKVSLLGYKKDLKTLKLYGCDSSTKFIPKKYLYTSVNQRIELLQGLMDTDGYADQHRLEIFTKSELLSKDIKELVLSLGGRVTITKKETSYTKLGNKINTGYGYRVSFSLPNNGIIPFKLERKINKFKPRTKYNSNKFIKSIDYHGEMDAQCIMVDNPEHLYVTDDYIVTHNTTLVTKIANTAYLQGKNVLQIFFEDPIATIQRKHLTAFTGVGLDKYKEEKKLDVIRLLYPKISDKLDNEIMLQKFSSDSVTMQDIKNLVRRVNNRLSLKNQKLDVVLIDYLECLDGEQSGGKEDWSSEGKTMRKFEALAADEDFAGWIATQGNRESISATEVTSDKSGGSIKKAQIAHFVVGIGKLNTQKEAGTATIVINKNRFGDDGIVFSDCTFLNKKLFINTNKDRSSIAAFQRQKQKQANSGS